MKPMKLDKVALGPARLERELQITIQTPCGGLDNLLTALGRELPLKQGAYDNCLYVRRAGSQRFRALEGSHAGAEKTIQTTDAAEIVFSIPFDEKLLSRVFEVIFENHVNEEPTVRVQELWGSRSRYLDDKNNPNRYWNRPDAKQIHGTATPVPNCDQC